MSTRSLFKQSLTVGLPCQMSPLFKSRLAGQDQGHLLVVLGGSVL